MAKLRGAEVTALASGGHIAFVKDLGADHVVDRTKPHEETLEGFDMVLDAYGPEAQARSWGLLTKGGILRSEEHTSELQSLVGISYGVLCLKKKKKELRVTNTIHTNTHV